MHIALLVIMVHASRNENIIEIFLNFQTKACVVDTEMSEYGSFEHTKHMFKLVEN